MTTWTQYRGYNYSDAPTYEFAVYGPTVTDGPTWTVVYATGTDDDGAPVSETVEGLPDVFAAMAQVADAAGEDAACRFERHLRDWVES